MAKFKVGDRVRFVRNENPSAGPEVLKNIGVEGRITGVGESIVFPSNWTVTFANGDYIYAPSEHLEPLTPPDAKTLTAEDILALPDLREADCPLPVPLRMTGLVA